MLEPFGPSRPPYFTEQVVLGHSFRVARWYADDGAASRPLLFFTGIGANIELLAPLLARLRRRDVVTFDMPGVGGSAAWSGPYRLSAMADVAGQLLSDLRYGEVDVMGVSWGGMLAQEFAYRHPQSVGRLVLAATSPGFPMIPGSLSTVVKMISPHRYADAASIQAYLQTLYGGSSRNLDTYASRMQAPSSTGYLHQLLAIVGWTSVRKLTCVPAKTLILMGADDRLVPPANGHILKFLLDDARLEIVKNAGHLFALTHLDSIVRKTENFLGDRAPSRPEISLRQSLPWRSV